MPNRTLGFLLLVIVGIGAIYAPVKNAARLGQTLLEVARRGIQHTTDKDNRLARSLPMVQTMVIWSTIKSIGSPRALELAQVNRSVWTTQLRQLGVFTDPPFVAREGESVERRWARFIELEERKRLVMACFILEAEFTTLHHLPPLVTLSDLKTTLPAAEELWAASTAEAWYELHAITPTPLMIEVVMGQVLADSPFPLPAAVRLGPLSTQVLIQGLHLLTYSSRQFRLLGMGAVAGMAVAGVRRSLCRLARGPNPFEPEFGGTVGGTGLMHSAVDVAYHFAQIATYLAPEELDVVAGKESTAEGSAAASKVSDLNP